MRRELSGNEFALNVGPSPWSQRNSKRDGCNLVPFFVFCIEI